MSRKRSKQQGIAISEGFQRVDPDIEDEILGVYSIATKESDDLYLNQLPKLLSNLKIPICFTNDITQCIDYYYEYMHSQSGDIKVNGLNYKRDISLQLVQAYSINTSQIDSATINIIDIIDIDKLIKNFNKLIKFRNAYKHIYQSWKLFVDGATSINNGDESVVISYQLTLPDLKKIKSVLRLDEETHSRSPLGDSFLIDMLSYSSTTHSGDPINYDFNKAKKGSYITIKDFAEILGNLGELD